MTKLLNIIALPLGTPLRWRLGTPCFLPRHQFWFGSIVEQYTWFSALQSTDCLVIAFSRLTVVVSFLLSLACLDNNKFVQTYKYQIASQNCIQRIISHRFTRHQRPQLGRCCCPKVAGRTSWCTWTHRMTECKRTIFRSSSPCILVIVSSEARVDIRAALVEAIPGHPIRLNDHQTRNHLRTFPSTTTLQSLSLTVSKNASSLL